MTTQPNPLNEGARQLNESRLAELLNFYLHSSIISGFVGLVQRDVEIICGYENEKLLPNMDIENRAGYGFNNVVFTGIWKHHQSGLYVRASYSPNHYTNYFRYQTALVGVDRPGTTINWAVLFRETPEDKPFSEPKFFSYEPNYGHKLDELARITQLATEFKTALEISRRIVISVK